MTLLGVYLNALTFVTAHPDKRKYNAISHIHFPGRRVCHRVQLPAGVGPLLQMCKVCRAAHFYHVANLWSPIRRAAWLESGACLWARSRLRPVVPLRIAWSRC